MNTNKYLRIKKAFNFEFAPMEEDRVSKDARDQTRQADYFNNKKSFVDRLRNLTPATANLNNNEREPNVGAYGNEGTTSIYPGMEAYYTVESEPDSRGNTVRYPINGITYYNPADPRGFDAVGHALGIDAARQIARAAKHVVHNWDYASKPDQYKQLAEFLNRPDLYKSRDMYKGFKSGLGAGGTVLGGLAGYGAGRIGGDLVTRLFSKNENTRKLGRRVGGVLGALLGGFGGLYYGSRYGNKLDTQRYNKDYDTAKYYLSSAAEDYINRNVRNIPGRHHSEETIDKAKQYISDNIDKIKGLAGHRYGYMH